MRGTNEYNLALGERRAKAAMSYLVSKGIAVDRITEVSIQRHGASGLYQAQRELLGEESP